MAYVVYEKRDRIGYITLNRPEARNALDDGLNDALWEVWSDFNADDSVDVYPWQCDHLGHMNVMWYVGKFDEATWQGLTMLGLTPSFLREQNRGMGETVRAVTGNGENMLSYSGYLLRGKRK